MSDVLFVCVHNAGRSQMAKALFNHLAQQRGLRLHAGSAGTQPGPHIDPQVLQVMNELGLDLSHEHPSLLTNDMAQRARRIITMGCAVDSNACPAVLLKGVEDWASPTPKAAPSVRSAPSAIKSSSASKPSWTSWPTLSPRST
jgi:arsenate reductase